ncbi:MAG: methylated-DNA--[protein]-cysteine S-methyltransferase [Gammaproteobacteria bacterium]
MHYNTDMRIISRTIKTPIGNMLAATTPQGVCLFEFMDVEERLKKQLSRLERVFSATVNSGKHAYLDQLETEMAEYFSGNRKQFTVSLDFRGTDFQKRSWLALQQIPYGETRSYQQQACAINHPKAARAVANANHHNKLSVLIPCHRVIAKDGSLAGYGGEVWRKQFLLELEQGCNSEC